ncbi:helicase-related protein [Thermaerobacter litoralis]
MGSLVRFREREWIVLPCEDPDLVMLKPLQGSDDEITGAFLPLEGAALEPASFPWPDPQQAREFAAARLLRDAARLVVRNTAGPFRSVGQIAFRPRPYQIVPLLMALRMNPVRLLIADDVGVGKTIEAGLIAKELLARGEAQRLLVLCPPVLCEQWQRELATKFGLQAVVVRTSTYSQLARDLPAHQTVYQAYPFIVASIDFVKTERNRMALLADPPDLVIVDEAHGVARPPSGAGRDVQLRHELVQALASDAKRHLILLTATPHSGIRESFASLLGLLHKPLETLAMAEHLPPEDRRQIARHYIQRRREDVKEWLGGAEVFPERDPINPDKTGYNLHPDYKALFDDVLAFSRERIQRTDGPGYQQRMRYWGALALLRSIMSSPAAAVRALERRIERLEARELEAETVDAVRRPEVLDLDDVVFDSVPQDAIADLVRLEGDALRNRLARFRSRAQALMGAKDHKLAMARHILAGWLQQGYQPIVYCRFVDTAEYVATALKALEATFEGLAVGVVTGLQADEEREARIRALLEAPRRILVATDCMSEGVDLQYGFNAVLHYDLPWNPNRLEQREGRVDRYGQPSPKVPTAVLWGMNNPMDATVLDVLIRKAREIYNHLKIAVPVPMDSTAIMEALVASIFEGPRREGVGQQLSLTLPAVDDFTRRWETSARREQATRSLYAKLSPQAQEVLPLYEAAEAAAGTPDDVKVFVFGACRRLGIRVEERGSRLWVERTALEPWLPPRSGRGRAPALVPVVFDEPVPEGAVLLHRLHPWVEALAQQVIGEALRPHGSDRIARCGAFQTLAVSRRTAVLLLRIRYRIASSRSRFEQFAEEVVLGGFRAGPDGLSVEWLPLDGEEVRDLLSAQPDLNIAPVERRQQLEWALKTVKEEDRALNRLVAGRMAALEELHNRLVETNGGGVSVEAYPPDVLGVWVLVPVPGRRRQGA